MVRLKRSLLVITALGLLIVAVIGGLAYKFYFSPTSYALQRAEAFLFRRMQVAKLGPQAEYRFYFVTNRRPADGDGPLEERFGAERQEDLTFGYFDIKVDPTLGLGKLINASEWFQNREIKITAVQELDQTAFVRQLQERVRNSPHESLLVLVHGFRNTFPTALRKSAFVGHVLDIDTPLLVFDWPGNQGSSPSGYRQASQVAKASAPDLARTLGMTIRDIRSRRLWLIANSMGAQVVVEAFRLLDQEADLSDRDTEIEDVVLTAPDVDFNEFDERFRHGLEALARQTTVYVSSNDRALLASRILNRGQRLGESTLNPRRKDSAVRVVDRDPADEGVTVVDVTPVNRTRNFHNFSLETPEFYDDVFLRLTNAETPRSRLVYPVEAPNGTIYWVLTRGR
jgi:esterase/lipase superfamily enzyme